MSKGTKLPIIMAVLLALCCGCPASGGTEDTAAAQAEQEQTAQPCAADEHLEEEPEEFRPPDWVLAEPARMHFFVPIGDVITLGMLGSHGLPPEQAREEAEFGRFYFYNSDGERIGDLPDGIHWWEFYFEGWREKALAYAEEGISSGEMNGYILFYRKDMDNVVEQYDYDGTPLPEDFDPWSAPGNRMHIMSGDELLERYGESV